MQQGDSFIISLTYGPHTSWYVNLLANPGQLQWEGRSIPVTHLTLGQFAADRGHRPGGLQRDSDVAVFG